MKSKVPATLFTMSWLFAGCAVNATRDNPPQAREVPSGLKSKIAYFYNVNASCQPVGVPQITITKAPANGTVNVGAGENPPQYPADNPLSSCNQQPVDSAEVYYQSAVNFHGNDAFAIQVRYSSSFTQTYPYNVTVD